jgi:hypothetical protein
MSSSKLVNQVSSPQAARVEQISESTDLLQFFVVFIVLGFAIGAVLPLYLAEPGISLAQSFGAAFAFGSVGASAGLLLVGCYDVIIQGRLEEE